MWPPGSSNSRFSARSIDSRADGNRSTPGATSFTNASVGDPSKSGSSTVPRSRSPASAPKLDVNAPCGSMSTASARPRRPNSVTALDAAVVLPAPPFSDPNNSAYTSCPFPDRTQAARVGHCLRPGQRHPAHRPACRVALRPRCARWWRRSGLSRGRAFRPHARGSPGQGGRVGMWRCGHLAPCRCCVASPRRWGPAPAARRSCSWAYAWGSAPARVSAAPSGGGCVDVVRGAPRWRRCAGAGPRPLCVSSRGPLSVSGWGTGPAAPGLGVLVCCGPSVALCVCIRAGRVVCVAMWRCGDVARSHPRGPGGPGSSASQAAISRPGR